MSIEKAYDSWSKQYDTNENVTRDLDEKATAETLSNYSFKRVIELGCGTGKNTKFLLTEAEEIIGLDFSQEMLAIAKQKFNTENVAFLNADINKPWQIDTNSADLVTSCLTLEHIEDLGHVFNQANNALMENGLFFISELHPFKQYLGSKAKFETENGIEELKTFPHHISDYLTCANENGLELIELKEWFDNKSKNEIPRLISFLFLRKCSH